MLNDGGRFEMKVSDKRSFKVKQQTEVHPD